MILKLIFSARASVFRVTLKFLQCSDIQKIRDDQLSEISGADPGPFVMIFRNLFTNLRIAQ